MNMPAGQNNQATLNWNGYTWQFNMQHMSTEINIITGVTEIRIEGCTGPVRDEQDDGTLPIFGRTKI